MHDRRPLPCLRALLGALALLAAVPALAEPTVSWSTVERTYPMRFHPRLLRGKTGEVTVTNVVLTNEHLRIEVAPDLGGRVMRVTYRKDGTELFNVLDSLRCYNVWDAGGWRPSFPFFEHGLRFEGQPAGWRVVENEDDGSATLAMEMRFGRFLGVEEINYKGRFSHLRLGRTITLAPGQGHFACRTFVENPLPYRVGLRLWTTAQFPLAGDAEFIIPAERTCYHRAQRFRDWTPGEGHALWRNWKDSDSHFAVAREPHPFVGVYYPSEDRNHVRVTDPERAPGAKLYAWGRRAGDARLFEFWGGLDRVFEEPGRFLPAFSRRGFTERWYVARGIGRVAYANQHAAVGLRYAGAAGGRTSAVVSVTPSREIADAELLLNRPGESPPARPCSGPLSLAPLQPHRAGITVDRPGDPVTVTLLSGDRELLKVTLPLPPAPEDEDLEERLEESIEPDEDDPYELAVHSELRGWIVAHRDWPALPTTALDAAREHAKAHPNDPEGQVLLGRIAYRLGELDAAAEALTSAVTLDNDCGIAHHFLGLVRLAQDDPRTARERFRSAVRADRPHPEAGYFAALGHIARGDLASAVAALRSLVKARPDAVRPRLLLAAALARLGKLEEARKLIVELEREDPSSVEIAYVATRAFPTDADRQEALKKLSTGNPESNVALERLQAEIEHGRWSHPERPGPYEHVGGRHRLNRRW